jgi:hypothetical protein
VSYAQAKFDASGELADEETRAHLRKLLEALVTWTQRVAPSTDTRLVAHRSAVRWVCRDENAAKLDGTLTHYSGSKGATGYAG